MASLFFESREPPHATVSVEEHLANYPAGSYEIRGLSWDGKGLTGAATCPAACTCGCDGDNVCTIDLLDVGPQAM